MRLLQALAGQKIVGRQCSSSGTGKVLSTSWGYLPVCFSLALLPNRLHSVPAFCLQEVSFALSLNMAGEKLFGKKPLHLHVLLEDRTAALITACKEYDIFFYRFSF